jgi:hypothetical protein
MAVSRELVDYVIAHTIQGPCQCGKCNDFNKDVNVRGDVDLTLFKVDKKGAPSKEKLKALCEANDLMATEVEVSYVALGNRMGNQGLALRLMALGHILGLWTVLSPNQVLPALQEEDRMRFCELGMITYTLKSLEGIISEVVKKKMEQLNG